MKKTIAEVCLAAALLFGTPAFGAAPGEITNVIKAEEPYGAGTLRWFLLSVYDASLWTDAPKWSMQTPFALAIAYRMSFSAAELTDSTMDEMKNVNPGLGAAALADYRAAMAKIYSDVRSGDTITALYTPDGLVRFFHNGRPSGQLRDQTFARSFFAIWLSPETSEPGLRAKLLRLGT